ncbi:hypothetical protein AB2C23_33190, partial [Pseudomonas aeruginosa]
MSAERHYLGAARCETPRSLRPNAGAPSHTWARYLDVIRHGLLMIDDAGRVIVSNAPAERLLTNFLPPSGEPGARPLLR